MVRINYFRAITVLVAMMAAAIVTMLVGYGSAVAQDGGGDTTPPTVLRTVPQDGAQNVDRQINVKAKFSEAMRESSINQVTFYLHPGNYTYEDINSGIVPSRAIKVSYNKDTRTAKLNPLSEYNNKYTYNNKLKANTTYTAVVEGAGDTDNESVKDRNGNKLAIDKIWHFTTGAN